MSIIPIMIACFILTITVTGVSANAINGDKNVVINGVGYDIQPMYIENIRYLHSDSYYIPLRETFEKLGCTVNYDIDRHTAPEYWHDGEYTCLFPDYSWRQNLVVDDLTSQIYGATFRPNANMPIIEVISASGEKWYTQIGSEAVTTDLGMLPPPILFNDQTYISIASVAGYLVPKDEDMSNSILWDVEKHDRYYMGRLLWDEETQVVTIDVNNKPERSKYNQTLDILNDKATIVQKYENNTYAICFVDDYTNDSMETCLAIEKATGKIAVLYEFDKELWWAMRAEFETNTEVVIINRNDTEANRNINLTEYSFFEIE